MTVLADLDDAVIAFLDDTLSSASGSMKQIKRAHFRSLEELIDVWARLKNPSPCGILSLPEGIARGENRTAGPAPRVDFNALYRFAMLSNAKLETVDRRAKLYADVDVIFTNVWDKPITSGVTSGWQFRYIVVEGFEFIDTETVFGVLLTFFVQTVKAAT